MGWNDGYGKVSGSGPGGTPGVDDYQQRDPNAGAPPGQWVPQNANGMTGDPLGGRTPFISHENYQWDGREGGADADQAYLNRRNDAAQTRTGVVMNNTLANLMAKGALDARSQQQYLGTQYQQTLNGQGPSVAQLQGNASLEQALVGQAQAGQGPTQQGIAAMGAGNAAAAQGRGAEVSAAVHGYGQTATQMRAGDLQSMGLSQTQAYRQAQLEASQRARNDQMARFYVGQGNDIQRQQLTANENYEAQRDANYANAQQDYQRSQDRKQARMNRDWGQGTDLVAGTLTMGMWGSRGSQATSGNGTSDGK